MKRNTEQLSASQIRELKIRRNRIRRQRQLRRRIAITIAALIIIISSSLGLTSILSKAAEEPDTYKVKTYSSVMVPFGSSLYELSAQYADADYYITKQKGLSPYYGAFGTSIEIFGFDYSVNFSYQFGAKTYDSTYATFMSTPTDSHLGYHMH